MARIQVPLIDAAKSIQQAKRGKVEFRADTNAQILLPLARISYTDNVIEQNLRYFALI